jgi:hypothetical protein
MALYGTLVIKMLQVHPQNTAKAKPPVLVIWRNIYYKEWCDKQQLQQKGLVSSSIQQGDSS